MRLALARGRQFAARRRSFSHIIRRASSLEALEERCVFAAPLAVNDAIGVQQGAVATSTEYVAKVLADSPVSYWRLNEAPLSRSRAIRSVHLHLSRSTTRCVRARATVSAMIV